MQTKHLKWGLTAGLLALLVAALSVWAGSTAVPPTASAQPDLPTLEIPADAPIVYADVDGARNPKLDGAMQAVVDAADAGLEAITAVADAQSLRTEGDRVQTLVLTDADRVKTAVAAMTAVGGDVTGTAGNSQYVQAWIPADALRELTLSPAIDAIRRPSEPVLLETAQAVQATTEGLAAINGNAWHAAGITGAGVKIAVIDGGFLGYAGLLGGDLPANLTVRNFVDGEGNTAVDATTPHGTACAEIVYDIAPDAQLYLLKVGTNIDLQEAVNYAIAQDVDVISTSLGWYNLTPGDGSGFFEQLVAQARAAGIIWATAAGNDRLLHWGGAFTDGDSDGYHDFTGGPINVFGPGNGQAWAIPAGTPVRVFMRWDDWGNPTQDYDLLVLRWNGNTWVEVANSRDPQTGGGGQMPTEYAATVASGADTAYGFVVQRMSSNRPVDLEILAPKVAPSLNDYTAARSLSNLADAASAVTVAALDVDAPYPQEPYSAEGPTNGPGGTADGGFIKPDLAAFANVSTESYGVGAFGGTSAATPHVAGAMALVLDAFPGYTPQQVEDFLTGRAIDMGIGGRDTVFGYGRLQLGAPPTAVTPTPTPTINVTDRGYLPALFAPLPTATSQPTAVPTATPTATPSMQTGSMQVDNQVGGPVLFELVGYEMRTLLEGVTLWSGIPAANYTARVFALSGPCAGASLERAISIAANEVAGLSLSCGGANGRGLSAASD